MLKKVKNASTHTNDINIGRLFSTVPLLSNPSNRCIPLLDALACPEEDTTFLVLPFLTHWEFPKFVTIGEAVACFQQVFEVSTSVSFIKSWHVHHSLGPCFHAQSACGTQVSDCFNVEYYAYDQLIYLL
jgi:hypothetical protein